MGISVILSLVRVVVIVHCCIKGSLLLVDKSI